MKTISLRFTSLLAGVLLSTAAVLAQGGGTYAVTRFTIGGGGGTSTGGPFSVNGTIGQWDAGAPINGGVFTVTGGFWALQGDSGLPRLSIRLADGNSVVLSWPNPSIGYQLEQSSATGWTEVTQTPGITAGHKEVTLPIDAPYRFFRLRKP